MPWCGVQARFDADEACKATWDDVWHAIASSPEHTVKLYIAEIVPAVCSALSASSWAIKQQAANALAGECRGNLLAVLGDNC